MITNATELTLAIQKLESDRTVQGYLIRQEFEDAYHSINPFNPSKDDSAASPMKGNNMFSTSVGLAAGYLIKKWIIGKSDNPIRTMIGSAVQIGAINLIARYQGSIEVVGQTLLHLFLHKEEKKNVTV